jgi:DNA-binding response OmpR family regulator
MEHLAAELLKGARVLVVEDEYYLADDLVMALREAGAEPVGPFASIAQAEEVLGEGSVDAAIVDMNLRGEMTFDFVAGLCSKVPCVVVSGYTAEALPESVANLCRLEKPVDPKKVLAELSRQMRRG